MMATMYQLSIILCLLVGLSSAKFVPQWLVQLQDSDASYFNDWIVQYNLVNKGQVGDLKDTVQLTFSFGLQNVDYSNITELLNDHVKVVLAEQDYRQDHVLKSFSFPDDPYWQYQWPLYDTATPNADINVVPAWIANVTGYGTTALVVDNGIQTDHPDLINNIDLSLCYSVINKNNDITPMRSLTDPDYPYGHGTSCAGEIAMIHDNGICGTGVAYKATIGGFQLDFKNKVQTDEVMAFGFKSQLIQVSSNSWGPYDDGYTVEGPGTFSKQAIIRGITNGRNGLGTIYVFSAGNGGDDGDSCAADGYASSIYTIAIGSVNQNGDPPFYEEACSAKMAVTYAHSTTDENQVVSTWPDSDCVTNFTGTSAAAPLATGAILLALEVNPNLSWRDIQYLIVYTSNTDNLDGFTPNGAGIKYADNNDYGFGVIDVKALVNRARYWTPVGPATVTTKSIISQSETVTSSNDLLVLPFTVSLTNNGTLEHVVLTTTFTMILESLTSPCYGPSNVTDKDHTGPRRGQTSITLCSPSKTCSEILPTRANDFINCEGYTKWPFMSVNFWGEDPNGQWELKMKFEGSTGGASLSLADITLYTLQNEPEDVVDKCDPACATPTGCSYGNGSQYCDSCGNGYYRNVTTLQCVSNCSPGSCIIEDTCVFYNGSCPVSKSHKEKLSRLDVIIIIAVSSSVGLLAVIAVMMCCCCFCCLKNRQQKIFYDETPYTKV